MKGEDFLVYMFSTCVADKNMSFDWRFLAEMESGVSLIVLLLCYIFPILLQAEHGE